MVALMRPKANGRADRQLSQGRPDRQLRDSTSLQESHVSAVNRPNSPTTTATASIANHAWSRSP